MNKRIMLGETFLLMSPDGTLQSAIIRADHPSGHGLTITVAPMASTPKQATVVSAASTEPDYRSPFTD